MTALADPFSRVHPLFWPVLWVSLRAFVAWSGRLIEAGNGYAGLSIEITWYGWIRVTWLDLSPERARFNRHMAGVDEDDWRSVLARAGRRVRQAGCMEAKGRYAPVVHGACGACRIALHAPYAVSRRRQPRGPSGHS
ncbi:MAG: hypothetical protein MRY64_06430 [Hyphomonadaceae bacterium]|nr:hypothetical protein [Hyphomonadaceae bacterium]